MASGSLLLPSRLISACCSHFSRDVNWKTQVLPLHAFLNPTYTFETLECSLSFRSWSSHFPPTSTLFVLAWFQPRSRVLHVLCSESNENASWLIVTIDVSVVHFVLLKNATHRHVNQSAPPLYSRLMLASCIDSGIDTSKQRSDQSVSMCTIVLPHHLAIHRWIHCVCKISINLSHQSLSARLFPLYLSRSRSDSTTLFWVFSPL